MRRRPGGRLRPPATCNVRWSAGHVRVMEVTDALSLGSAAPSRGATDGGRQAEFEAAYRAHSRAILAYALRRCEQPEDAADVLAEVMLTAWRRWDAMPTGDEGRLWLYGVARRVLANRSRAEARQLRVADRLRAALSRETASHNPFEHHSDSGDLRAALRRLSADDREVLMLSAAEQLRAVEIAQVLGTRAVTIRSRLHRARRRLRIELENTTAERAARPKIDRRETNDG